MTTNFLPIQPRQKQTVHLSARTCQPRSSNYAARYLIDPESTTEDLEEDLSLFVEVAETLSSLATREDVGHAAAWFTAMARGLCGELEGRRMQQSRKAGTGVHSKGRATDLEGVAGVTARRPPHSQGEIERAAVGRDGSTVACRLD
jgi:hypothetical protein